MAIRLTFRRALVLALASAGITAWAPNAHALSWRFIVAGDSRGSSNTTTAAAEVNETIVKELGVAAKNENAAYILSTGDQIYSGTNTGNNDAAFTLWKNDWTAGGLSASQLLPCMGNHDFYNSDLAGTDANYKAAFSLPTNGPAGTEQERTYSVTYQNAIFICLDEYATSYQVNQTWLNAQLTSPTRPTHVFVFGHLPAFQVTTHHTDTLDDHPAARNTFWQSLTNAGARVYFAGHEHFYDRTRLDDGDGNPNDDLYQIIAGTAGAPLTTNAIQYDTTNAAPYTPVQIAHENQYGYTLVEVNDNTVTLTWKHRVSAGVYTAADSFSYTVPVPEPATLGLLLTGAAALCLRRRRRS